MEDIIETLHIEAVDGEIVMYFDVRDAEEPEVCERLLDNFAGAEVLVTTEVATGQVILSIRGADAIRRTSR
jgi:hypothetical protein